MGYGLWLNKTDNQRGRARYLGLSAVGAQQQQPHDVQLGEETAHRAHAAAPGRLREARVQAARAGGRGAGQEPAIDHRAHC